MIEQTKHQRWAVINTWNGGSLGRKVVFVSDDNMPTGHNQCFAWILHNTPFSFHEATTNQGYLVQLIDPDHDSEGIGVCT